MLAALAVTESYLVGSVLRRVLYHEVRVVLVDLGMACVTPAPRVLLLMIMLSLDGRWMEV